MFKVVLLPRLKYKMASQTAETLQRKLAASVIYIFKTASRKLCRTVKRVLWQ